jgi:hypothetical protein
MAPRGSRKHQPASPLRALRAAAVLLCRALLRPGPLIRRPSQQALDRLDKTRLAARRGGAQDEGEESHLQAATAVRPQPQGCPLSPLPLPCRSRTRRLSSSGDATKTRCRCCCLRLHWTPRRSRKTHRRRLRRQPRCCRRRIPAPASTGAARQPAQGPSPPLPCTQGQQPASKAWGGGAEHTDTYGRRCSGACQA